MNVVKTVLRRPSLVFLAAATLWLAATPLAGQPAPLAGFDDWTAAAVKAWRIPGLAIAVVKDGGVVFAKGYGVREAGKPEPVDTHTLFAIGSTTKAMTAALVGMLVDDQKLAWDDPVTRYLPSFQLKDPAVTRSSPSATCSRTAPVSATPTTSGTGRATRSPRSSSAYG